jgi:hypothetical protein
VGPMRAAAGAFWECPTINSRRLTQKKRKKHLQMKDLGSAAVQTHSILSVDFHQVALYHFTLGLD